MFSSSVIILWVMEEAKGLNDAQRPLWIQATGFIPCTLPSNFLLFFNSLSLFYFPAQSFFPFHFLFPINTSSKYQCSYQKWWFAYKTKIYSPKYLDLLTFPITVFQKMLCVNSDTQTEDIWTVWHSLKVGIWKFGVFINISKSWPYHWMDFEAQT